MRGTCSAAALRAIACVYVALAGACSGDDGGTGGQDTQDAGPDEAPDDTRDAALDAGPEGGDAMQPPRDGQLPAMRCGDVQCPSGQTCDRSFAIPRCVGTCEGVACAPGLACAVRNDVGTCVSDCQPACGPGQRCEAAADGARCVDNTCQQLGCAADQVCVPAPQGTGSVCKDNTCSDDLSCSADQHCQGGLCMGDVCTPFETRCEGATVRECAANGASVVDRMICSSQGELVSTCESDGTRAACSCRDDWDCPAFTECQQGSCVGTGRAPTCFLPPQPFSDVLPRREPGFPWGGDDRDGYTSSGALQHGDPPSRDAQGAPFPRHAQASTVPIVANLDDDNGDGLVDELDVPEIVLTTFCDTNYFTHGVLRAIHGGGPDAGKDMFAVCEDKLWQASARDAMGNPLPYPDCACNEGDLEPTGALAVGDLDADGLPEIVVVAHARVNPGNEGNQRVLIFRNTGELISSNELGFNLPGANPAVTIANVDGEALAELVVGPVLVTLTLDGNGHIVIDRTLRGLLAKGVSANTQGAVSCVADLDDDGVMEIVAGGTVYQVPRPPAGASCADPQGNPDTIADCNGQLRVLWSARNGSTLIEGFCAVADVLGAPPAAGGAEIATGPGHPLDGRPEVLLIGSGRLRVYDALTCGFDGTRCVPRVDVQLATSEGGPPNVDDFDGDGFPEVGTAFLTNYVVHDFQPSTAACPAWPESLHGAPAGADDAMAPPAANVARMPPALGCTRSEDCGDPSQFSCSKQGQCVCLHNGWRSTTQDASSRVTGSSVFDFNGDGAAEVVYNDECYFRIYDGKTGTVYQRLDSQSPTRIEYPVVADVDSDGNAEIVFTGSNARSESCVHRTDAFFYNGVNVIGDQSDRWVAARRIWNQHAYHVTNVLENGSIPPDELSSWGSYNGRSYNTYRSNLPPYGNLAPDLTVAGLQVSSPDVRCGEALSRELRIIARVVNRGDLRVGANVMVRFEDQAGSSLGMAPLGASLQPGAETFVTLDYTAPSVEQLPARIRALVDADESERECVEDNNTREVAVTPAASLPELRVVVGGTNARCPERTLNVQVINEGSQAVPAVKVAFYAGNPASGAKVIKTVDVANVPANGMTAVDVELDVGFLDVTVYVQVDPDDAVSECNDGNNLATQDVFCQQIVI